MVGRSTISSFFFFNDTATTEIYTLSLHDALPISALRPSSKPATNAKPLRKGALATKQPSAADRPDRKSTRLNSSHQIISYAVFCLKKKNTPRSQRDTPPAPALVTCSELHTHDSFF